MSCPIRLRFLNLVSMAEKIPPELAGEFSPERVASVIGGTTKYAAELIREWLRGELKALSDDEKMILCPIST